MGVDVYDWHCLYVELRRDLAKSAPWGIAWWPIDPALSRMLVAHGLGRSPAAFHASRDGHSGMRRVLFTFSRRRWCDLCGPISTRTDDRVHVGGIDMRLGEERVSCRARCSGISGRSSPADTATRSYQGSS